MIQIATIEQLEEVAPLFDQYMVFYEKPSDLQRHRAYLQERLSNGEATIFLAYDSEGHAIGFALIYRCFSSVSLGSVLILNDLFVANDQRGKGIGEQLIKQTFDLAQRENATRVDLGTNKTNTIAQGLYHKMGFIRDNQFYSYSYSIT